jgi:hypothetical protein
LAKVVACHRAKYDSGQEEKDSKSKEAKGAGTQEIRSRAKLSKTECSRKANQCDDKAKDTDDRIDEDFPGGKKCSALCKCRSKIQRQ